MIGGAFIIKLITTSQECNNLHNRNYMFMNLIRYIELYERRLTRG
jgi:hypothetical protein